MFRQVLFLSSWPPDDADSAILCITYIQSGLCTLNVTKHEYCAIGGVAWLPNGKGFFSGGLDMRVLCWVSAYDPLTSVGGAVPLTLDSRLL